MNGKIGFLAAALKQINRIPVSSEMLEEALLRHSAMPAEKRSVFEARISVLIQFIEEKGFNGSRLSDLALAINFRLTALAHLVKGDQMHQWTLPGDERGQVLLHADMLKAAAKEPLIENAKGQAAFDSPAFAKHVLRVAEARGRA